MIALIGALLLIAIAALASLRLFNGPTLYDRALAVHAMVLIAALAAASIAVAQRRADMVDLAIALIGADLVLAVAMLKFFRFRSLQPPMARAHGEGGE